MAARTFYGAMLLGFVAYWLALGMGIPAWRQWQPGDASDIGVFVFLAVLALGPRRPAHPTHLKGE